MAAKPTDRPSLEFLAGLVTGPTPEDAITFCAYLLPRREAVWWGFQCLNHRPELLTEQDRVMLAAAEAWVRRPDEEERNAALEIGLASPTKTPGAWIALAAGWSGGSMLGPDEAAIAPPPYLTPKAVNAGVLSALARVERLERAGTLRLFCDMGGRLATRN
jgi:hypothetical protein